MVGYNEISSNKLSQVDYAVAGAGSGFLTRMLCQPLDVIKIRFQLQIEPIKKSSQSKYQSICHAIHLIIKEEGLKALWKGHLPAQYLSISYGLVQFWCFEYFTKQASVLNITKNYEPFINFSCGAIAGSLGALASFPFDVVRTRLVGQSERKKIYSGVTEAFTNIWKYEGISVFYRGFLPTILQIAPYSGIQFMCYKLFDNIYINLIKSENTTISSSLLAGSLAGLCAKTSIYPFDLAKKRMQMQGFEEGRKIFGQTFKCKGFYECMIKIYKGEGYLGFFKGLSPSLIKAGVTTALHFTTYEIICHSLKNFKTN